MAIRTILVLGTNAGQADLIRHMKARGWRVESCSNRVGDIGESTSDRFHNVDISDVDAVTRLASQIGANLVYSVSSDLAMGTAIRVSERLSLPHFYDSNLFDLLAQKPKLREFLNNRDISKVPFTKIHAPEDSDGWSIFPCMVKPSDSQGQRGVVRIDNVADLKPAIADALCFSVESHTAIVEQYLEGVEVSCNTLVRNGRITIDVLSERLVHQGVEAGIPRGHLIPCANVSDENQSLTRKLVHDVIHTLGMRDGTLYFQIIITESGPKVVEIAPRLDGCHMWRLIEASTGEDYLAAAVDALLGEVTAGSPKKAATPGEIFELMFQQSRPNVKFHSHEHSPPVDALYHEHRYKDQDEISTINGKLEVVGYYVRKCSADEHLIRRSEL